MATLYIRPIKSDLRGKMLYITNPARTINPNNPSHMAPIAGHNSCFADVDEALRQFRKCEQRYRDRHKSAPFHPSVGAYHIFLSLREKEKADLYAILSELLTHPKTKGHPTISNVHLNTDTLHIHGIISNFSEDGTGVLGTGSGRESDFFALLDQLRNELDHILIRHGLSIIDDPHMMEKFPERESWIEEIVRSGKGKVMIPSDEFGTSEHTPHQKWMLLQHCLGRVPRCKIISYDRNSPAQKAQKKGLER